MSIYLQQNTPNYFKFQINTNYKFLFNFWTSNFFLISNVMLAAIMENNAVFTPQNLASIVLCFKFFHGNKSFIVRSNFLPDKLSCLIIISSRMVIPNADNIAWLRQKLAWKLPDGELCICCRWKIIWECGKLKKCGKVYLFPKKKKENFFFFRNKILFLLLFCIFSSNFSGHRLVFFISICCNYVFVDLHLFFLLPVCTSSTFFTNLLFVIQFYYVSKPFLNFYLLFFSLPMNFFSINFFSMLFCIRLEIILQHLFPFS